MVGVCAAPRRNGAKLVLRLRFVTLKRREGCEVGRRVHVGQQPVAIAEPLDVRRRRDVHVKIREQVEHLQPPIGEAPRRRIAHRAAVHRTQRMISAFGLRHHRRNLPGTLSASARQIGQVREETGRHKRHVAREQNQQLARCVRQGGVEAAERTAAFDAIDDRAGTGRRGCCAADDQNVVGQWRERSDLPIENRPAVDHEGALVAPAEPRRAAAGENRRRKFSSQPSALSSQPLRCSPDRSS